MMNNQKNIYRICIVNKKKFLINELYKITHIRDKNILVINSNFAKGRSVYIEKNIINKVSIKNLILLIGSRLKFKLSEQMQNDLKKFFEEEILVYEKK